MRSLPAVPGHAVRWSTSDAFLLLLAVQLLSFVWVGGLVTLLYDGTLPEPLPIGLLVASSAVLWVGYGLGPVAIARLKGDRAVNDFGARLRAGDVPLGLLIGVTAQVVVLPLLYWPILKLVDADPSGSAKDLVEAIDGPVDLVLLLLAVVVMAPLVEELFYRGLLLRALQRWLGPVPAVLISSTVFAAVHLELVTFPGLFVFGLIAGWLVMRTGRLGPAWAMHVGFNATTVVALHLA
jgi:membrane protease YdiL (CAAX protease family)